MAVAGLSVIFVGSGCGENQATPRDGAIASNGLLLPRDLPPGAAPKRGLSRKNECNPKRYFEQRTAAAVEAPRYGIANISFSHAVGIFDSESTAESTLEDFTSDENNDCVLAEMEQEALERTGRPTRGRVAALAVNPPAGFSAKAARFVITTEPDERRYFDTVALRKGRAIVVVGCYAPRLPAPAGLRDRLARLAARHLAAALDAG